MVEFPANSVVIELTALTESAEHICISVVFRRERSMSGLSVLYASEVARERDWAPTPDRDRIGRLWEVYLAQLSSQGILG